MTYTPPYPISFFWRFRNQNSEEFICYAKKGHSMQFSCSEGNQISKEV